MSAEEFELPNEQHAEQSDGSDEIVREELLTLSEKGEIKYTSKYIKKANQDTLKKIKREYDRQQLEITNEFISNIVITKFADALEQFRMIDDSSELGNELSENHI